MEFDFPDKKGSGLSNMQQLRDYSEAAEIIAKLLTYNHNHRMSASQALKHSYFKELRE